MKELSIEEKAKHYDEAKARMRRAYNSNRCTIGFMNEIFPELAESKDERIRKGLIEYFLHYPDHEITYYGLKADFVIAWLKRQGKNNMGISEATKKKLEDNLNKALEKETPESFNEFLDGQKSTDKVEPKFNVGDWVTNGIDFTFQVRSIEDDMYLRSDDYFIDIETADKTFRLWTIQDAKNGDVLANDFHEIFIFKNIKENTVISYCSIIDRTPDIIVNSLNEMEVGSLSVVNFYPATKEKRDTLKRAIADAGYTFDFESKELKKIEQKFANTDFSDIRTWKYIVDAVLTERDGIGQYIDSPWTADVAEKLQKRFGSIKQKPEWSKEDERLIEEASEYIRKYAHKVQGDDSKVYIQSIADRIESLRPNY